jgi:hypothetical protein
MSKFSLRSIQSPPTSLAKTARSWRAQIDVFHACALAQRGELEAGRETFGVSFGGFAIDQQSDAFLERQGIEIRRSSLLLQGFGHSGQAECDQPFMGWMRQH